MKREQIKRKARAENSEHYEIEARGKAMRKCCDRFVSACSSITGQLLCCVQEAEVFVEEARQVGLAVGMHAPAQQGRVNTCLDHAL